jgi:hypothetical protein
MRAPTLSGFGEYKYNSISLDEARELLTKGRFVSGIKYQWDADLLRDLLGIYIPINRGEARLEVGDTAVVFEFPPAETEGKVPSKNLKTPLCVGLLKRTA